MIIAINFKFSSLSQNYGIYMMQKPNVFFPFETLCFENQVK